MINVKIELFLYRNWKTLWKKKYCRANPVNGTQNGHDGHHAVDHVSQKGKGFDNLLRENRMYLRFQYSKLNYYFQIL